MNIESELTCNTWSYGLSISVDTWVPQNHHHFISFSPVPCGERKKTSQVFFPLSPGQEAGPALKYPTQPNPSRCLFVFWIPTPSI